ncbi:hypothetical protein L1049_002069 [Liquidambar formosana]|uniref:HTH OST-type domain-containing protein n=1 Tax=Liquidambar formosana TaxID=63359 RepID=A0AAP0NGD6_LIQFO
MKPLSPRTIFFLFSPHPSPSSSFLSLQISHFSSSSHPPNPSSYGSSFIRRHEEESKNVRVSVWWDFENCSIPVGANVFRVAHYISAAVRANGIKGPINITAFGDIFQLSRSNQEALSSTGINLTHIPQGGKNSADRSLLVDLMYWVSQNPPPAHLFLISGDRDFASILHRLRMNNYNILLASRESAPGVLCSAASIMWHWNALVRGENLTGKHFNQPPDGPYGSWYGHYKVPLEDPFSQIEQPTCSQAELSEPGSEVNPRPVPKTVLKVIRHIVNLYPKGISITDLRSELSKSYVSIDKDLYGYKKFSRFLLSMPQILKLQAIGDGQFVVHGIIPKVPEPVELCPGISTVPVSNNGVQDFTKTPKSNREDRTKAVNGNSSLPQFPEVNVEEPPTKVQDPLSPGKNFEKVINAHITEGNLSRVEEQDSASKVGSLKKIWRKWFYGDDGASGKKSQSIPEECSTFGDSSEKTKSDEESVKSRSQSAHSVGTASLSSPSNDSVLEDETSRSSESYGDKSGTTPGFFSQIINWCKFWSGEPSPDAPGDQPNEGLNQINGQPGKHEIFSMDSFWSDMESFIDTTKGSVLVSQAKTRLHMAQNLQKEGPLVLRSLKESDLLLLVDLLIADKKWVEECPSQNLPFKLTRPIRKSNCLGHPRGSNGLRSIFLGTPSQSDLQKLPEHDREKRYQNLSHSGVSMPSINKKPLDRSRNEILADCQKLVDEILKEYPEGFNMASIRKMFLQRYGYSLDLQKLGYLKLASLLQTMPGVKIEYTHILPSGKVPKDSSLQKAVPIMEENASGMVTNSDNGLSDASSKDDYLDSPWEELGPVAGATSNKYEKESLLSTIAKEDMVRQMHLDYEPSLSDDDSSDSEGETPSLTGSEGQGKPIMNQEDSSLLQILDSWYSSKEDSNRRDGSENVDGMVDCSRDTVKPSGSSGVSIKSETPAANYERKQRPPKSYTFVSDYGGENKDKLIDGILGSLKKPGDSRMQA